MLPVRQTDGVRVTMPGHSSKRCKKTPAGVFRERDLLPTEMAVTGSSHENGDEGQQENQNRATYRQNNGHQGNNGFNNVGGIRGVRMVRHGNTFERKQKTILKHRP
jgi:hypothetical protein